MDAEDTDRKTRVRLQVSVILRLHAIFRTIKLKLPLCLLSAITIILDYLGKVLTKHKGDSTNENNKNQ